MKKTELSARALLEKIHDSFKKNFNGRELKLPEEVMCVIADDNDQGSSHSRMAFTSYKTALVFTIAGKEWAMAFGTACGGYMAESYNCDIVAVKISSDKKSDKEKARHIHEMLKRTNYFSHSLIYAMADGQLCTHDKEIFNLLSEKINAFTSKPLKTDPDFVTMSALCSIVHSTVKYRPEFADFIFGIFCARLIR